jgi:hypothetical protein
MSGIRNCDGAMNIPDVMSFFLAQCDICLAGAAVARRNVGKDIIAQSAGL